MISQNENICIFGRRGHGKSTLCKNMQEFFPNVIVFDTLYEYKNEENIFYNYKDFSDFIIETQNIKTGLRAVVQLNFEDAKDSEVFDEYIKIIYYRGNCTIVLEEAQNYASVYKIPDFLKQASLTGRHKGINFITTTQRIAEIHKTLLSQAHHIFAGYTDSPIDLKTLREYGFNNEEIYNLEKYHFVWKFDRERLLIDNELNI